MTTGLRTGFLRCGVAGALIFAAGSAQALTFISPMGEPFRTGAGDKKPEEVWFEGADTNKDGKISLAEYMADAGRFFKLLDTNHDGRIEAEEIQHYEDDICPETQGGIADIGPTEGAGGHAGGGGHGGHGGGHGGGGGGGSRRRAGVSSATQSQSDEENVTDTYLTPPGSYDEANMGAARFSYLDLPEPVAAMDVNFDRSISPSEFVNAARERFNALDANHDGVLTRDELPKLGGGGNWGKGGHHPHGDAPPPFSGGMGAPGTPPGD
jgi:hypothetical protein